MNTPDNEYMESLSGCLQAAVVCAIAIILLLIAL